MYSVFVLNFAKYVQLPEAKDGEYFVVGLFGSTTIGDYLKTVANLKTAGNQKISLKYCRSINETTGCHALFIAKDKTSQVSDVIQKLYHYNLD